jgi:hypothetical protein
MFNVTSRNCLELPQIYLKPFVVKPRSTPQAPTTAVKRKARDEDLREDKRQPLIILEKHARMQLCVGTHHETGGGGEKVSELTGGDGRGTRFGNAPLQVEEKMRGVRERRNLGFCG